MKNGGGYGSIFDEEDAVFGGGVIPMTAVQRGPASVGIFEAAGNAPSAAIADFANQQLRAAAMGVILGWLEQEDFTFDAFSNAAIVVADMDGDDEISDEEDEYLNDLLQECANALLTMGAESGNVTSFLDDEDDTAGEALGKFLTGKMDDVSSSDEELIAGYAVTGDAVFEAMKKVIRGGKVVLKKKRIRKVKLSAMQRAGLKKARAKAWTGAAKLNRKKSMRVRKQRGL
jgi:hypothetical protein